MKVNRHFFTRTFRPDWQSFLASALIAVFGLILFIWPGQTTGFVLNFIGGLMILLGAFRIIRYCVRPREAAIRTMDLGLGITLAMLGILLYAMKGFLLSIVPTLIGILLLVSGFIKLQAALDFKSMNVYRWQFQLAYAIISLFMGLIILINPFTTALLLMRIIGAAILIEGVEDLLSFKSFRSFYRSR